MVLFIGCELLSMGCSGQGPGSLTFYVAPDGDDAWSGTSADRDGRGGDGPFATLGRARTAVRDLKQAGPLPDGGVTVSIGGGIYELTETFALGPEDSGTEAAPVVWRAHPGEDVTFIGGTYLTDFGPVDDPAVLQRLDETASGNVLCADLSAQGITDYGDIDPKSGGRMELFFGGRYMTIARYPNDGWLAIANVPQEGGELVNEGRLEWEIDGIPRGRHYGRFQYDGDRPARWSKDNEFYIHGYYVYDWSAQYLKIENIDTSSREVFPGEPHHHYGYQKDARYYYLNILEELDAPGEFYVDRNRGMLYFWPPELPKSGETLYPTLEKIMITLTGASHITIRDIVFEGSRAGGITIDGGSNNTIAGCTFRNLGDDAVNLRDGTANGITGCDIYEVSAGGVNLSGGDRKTLTPGGNYVVNCDIHHLGRVFKTHRPAVRFAGVGNRIAHCSIHDAPHEGISGGGNDNIIEYNDITRVAEETGDVGAIYIAMDWTFSGNIIRYNYLHHIHGPVYLGCMAVYFDLPPSGNTIFGNVFHDLDQGFFNNNGRNNTIENNIFIKCNPSVHVNVHRALGQFVLGGPWRLVERLNEVDYRNPPYGTRYPFVLDIFEDGDPGIPRGNVVRRNISSDGRFLDLHNKLDFDIVTVESNYIADPILLHWGKKVKKEGEPSYDEYTSGDEKITDILAQYGNVVTDIDPGFVDVEGGDFSLREDAPAHIIGFEPIPFDRIGLYEDEFRTTLPPEAPE